MKKSVLIAVLTLTSTAVFAAPQPKDVNVVNTPTVNVSGPVNANVTGTIDTNID